MNQPVLFRAHRNWLTCSHARRARKISATFRNDFLLFHRLHSFCFTLVNGTPVTLRIVELCSLVYLYLHSFYPAGSIGFVHQRLPDLLKEIKVSSIKSDQDYIKYFFHHRHCLLGILFGKRYDYILSERIHRYWPVFLIQHDIPGSQCSRHFSNWHFAGTHYCQRERLDGKKPGIKKAGLHLLYKNSINFQLLLFQ